uniref:Putative secreted protein n=1 Tax=Amblyomma americanum TaxID=6943 RepID=A0A0C9SEH3_AMBAM
MQLYLGHAVILLLCMLSLMLSVEACDPKKRPSKDPHNDCVGKVCVKGECQDYGCTGCIGSNVMCNGYCTLY